LAQVSKETWLALEDTVFARVRLLVSLGEGGCLVALMLKKYITLVYTFYPDNNHYFHSLMVPR
jgi:hypothetical protein